MIECEERINGQVKKAYGTKIFCGGGSFLFEVPKDSEIKIKNDIEREYLRKTDVATVTIASYEERDHNHDVDFTNLDEWALRIYKAVASQKISKESFGLCTSFLGAEIREKKTMKKKSPFIETLPFGQRCDCCGKRMVSEEIPLGSEPSDKLKVCKICFHKHNVGKLSKGRFNEEFTKNHSSKIKSSQPHDLSELVSGAKRRYLAFLYADGNNIGSLLSHKDKKDDYKALSEALSNETKNSLFKSLSSVCGPALEKDDFWPFEIINVGGDDVTLLVQAAYAWEVAIQFLENFEKSKWPEGSGNITASCGIIIADEKYPMRYLQRLADGSIKRAKKKAKENMDKPTSAIDFLWLPNPVISERIDPLMGYYQRDYGTLTARPYTLKESKTLLDLARRASKDIPSTQRHLWSEALEQGIKASANTIYYNIARQSDASKRASMEKLLMDAKILIAPNDLQSPQSLWSFREGTSMDLRCTALLDILELAELLSMRKDLNEGGS